ncbi:hypothetical protein Tco_1568322 [Tanacetum coccineum]
MSITKEQQQALDDALVPREQRLMIGSCNYRLSTTFKPKEPTFQVALDVLSLTPFYQAFLITASVPAIYMHEFWTTASYHKHSIRFKLNTKRYSFDLDTFRNMLQICPKLPGKQFVDPPFEEEILTFMRELGYSGNIKLLSDVKVEMLPQPWRTFRTIINKCLSGKVTGIDSLRLSRAQILWGLYHQKNVDYVYLLWEDLVFQIENKESRKNKYMYYPRFTKVIINHFMSQDQSIPRRNKVDWHMANDDPILTTMRFIPQHEFVQKYGAILPDNLTNQAMKESEAYKTYFAFATGKAIPKPKYVRRSTKEKTEQAPEASSGKRLKATAKVTKSGKKKQPAKGLETLSKVALTKAEQMKIALKRSKTQQHNSHASGSGADEETGVTSGVPDVPSYDSEAEQISWKSSNEDERIDSDNDGDDFVHPKFSTHDEEDKEEDSFDPRVQTPSHVESTDDEDSDEEILVRMLRETNKMTRRQMKRIIDTYLANKISEAVKTITINEQLEAEVLTRSSNESKTSHAIAANLSELELKKILIDKMESNKSIHRSDEQKNLYKALVDAYEKDKDEEPSAGSNWGSKKRRARKEPESTSAPKEKTSKTTSKSTEGSKSHHKSADESAQAEEPMQTAKDLEEPAHQEFETGVTEDQPDEETSQLPDWFQKPAKLPTPDRDWNKTLPAAHGPVQPWLSTLA